MGLSFPDFFYYITLANSKSKLVVMLSRYVTALARAEIVHLKLRPADTKTGRFVQNFGLFCNMARDEKLYYLKLIGCDGAARAGIPSEYIPNQHWPTFATCPPGTRSVFPFVTLDFHPYWKSALDHSRDWQPLVLCMRVADKEKHMDWHTTVRMSRSLALWSGEEKRSLA